MKHPIYYTDSKNSVLTCIKLSILDSSITNTYSIIKLLELDQVIIVKKNTFDQAVRIFENICAYYDLEKSYKVQMQYVVRLLKDRVGKDDKAVTVNNRGPYQIIQPHCEGDSTSPLDLFALYCKKNAEHGGENIFSSIKQSADFSKLKAKEKVIIGKDLNDLDRIRLRKHHLDAKKTARSILPEDRIVLKEEIGSLVVRKVPLEATYSPILKKKIYSLWDNVTVHDKSFHQFQYNFLMELELLKEELGSNYSSYMHVEEDSYWAPADTFSSSPEDLHNYFDASIVHKMEPGDLAIINNKSWAHSANNWLTGNWEREIFAMYA